jgi:hypothetical protein
VVVTRRVTLLGLGLALSPLAGVCLASPAMAARRVKPPPASTGSLRGLGTGGLAYAANGTLQASGGTRFVSAWFKAADTTSGYPLRQSAARIATHVFGSQRRGFLLCTGSTAFAGSDADIVYLTVGSGPATLNWGTQNIDGVSRGPSYLDGAWHHLAAIVRWDETNGDHIERIWWDGLESPGSRFRAVGSGPGQFAKGSFDARSVMSRQTAVSFFNGWLGDLFETEAVPPSLTDQATLAQRLYLGRPSADDISSALYYNSFADDLLAEKGDSAATPLGDPPKVDAATPIVFGTAAATGGAISVIEQANRGAVGRFTISGADGATPAITLPMRLHLDDKTPNSTNTGTDSGTTLATSVMCRVTGMSDKRPTFTVPHPGGTNGYRTRNFPHWRPIGQRRWNRFDNRSGGSTGPKVVSNNARFTAAQDEIEVCFRGIVYGMEEAEELRDIVIGAGFGFRLASDLANPSSPDWSYAKITGANYTDYRSGGTVPDLALLGFGCRDDGAEAPAGRQKAILKLFTGVHASEDMGSWAIDAMVQTWLADIELRRRFVLHVYPQINAAGRYTGRSRGSAETAYQGWDMNRQFPDSTATIFEVVSLKQAVQADGFGELSIDAHSHQGATLYSEAFVLTPGSSQVITDWRMAANTFTTIVDITDQGILASDSLALWMWNNGTPGVTFEFNLNTDDQQALTDDIGAAWIKGARTLYDAGTIGKPI